MRAGSFPRVALAPALAGPLLAVLFLLAGCGSSRTSAPAPSTTTVPATTAPVAATTELTVYRVSGGVVVPTAVRVPRTQAVAAASLHALGLDASVAIADGTATVDLAQATQTQTAEVVYTLTQFPSVRRVDVGGRTGLTRDDLADFAPLILVDAPAAGADVTTMVHVVGSAVVFEGTLVVELVRDGTVLEQKTVTATAGAPERGRFQTTLAAPSPGPATVVAFAPSAADGSPQHRIDVPVTVG